MQKIYRYDSKTVTGFKVVDVEDDYELQQGELKELPTPCYTPMKLDSQGNLVSATQEESDKYAQEYLEKVGIIVENGPDPTQQQLAFLTKEIASLKQEKTALQQMVVAQNTTIAQLKGAN